VYGWRQLKKHKVTSAAAILSLALGIGACTSAFRLIDAFLLRPLPVAAPERLYFLSRQGLNWDGKPSIDQECEYPLFSANARGGQGSGGVTGIFLHGSR
jgi:putative ABC transport system permease protein